MFQAVSGLTFTEVSATTQADIVFAQTTDSSLPTASGRFPSWPNEGHQWYSVTNYDVTPVQGTYTWATILHETGHTVGLAHGHNPDSINPNWTGVTMESDRDSMEFSVMTYRSYVGGSATGGYTNEEFGYAQTLMMYDIRALQQLYGANFNTNSGNTTYTWDQTTGVMRINGVDETDPGANRIFLTIWDGGGIDTYDMSNYTTNLTVDLTPGSWSTLSEAQLANLGNGNFARANVFNALLFNDDVRSLIENAYGGVGNDQIVGNRGANDLRGNDGNDVLAGAGGNDTLRGGNGNDVIWGDASDGAPGTSGVGFGTGAYSHSNTHDSAALAFDLTNTFSLSNDPNIADSTTVPHTSMTYLSGTAGEPQWYAITLTAGSVLRLDIDFTAGSLDSYIRVFSSSNLTTPVAFNDDGGTDPGSVSGLDSRLTYTIPSTGTYYIVVGSYPGGTTNFTSTHGYELHVSVSDPASTELGTDGVGGNDTLYGDAGADTLHGGVGNDILYGGIGADLLDGGAGTRDRVIYSDSTVGLRVDLQVASTNTGIAAGDTFVGIEDLYGSNLNDSLLGNTGANILWGANGNDIIYGRDGADTMYGGSGNDILYGGIGADLLDGGAGTRDRVVYSDSTVGLRVDLQVAANNTGIAAGDTFVGIEDLYGANLNDSLLGNAVANMIWGANGNDIIYGRDGADTLYGGNGNDILYGGIGADLLDGGAGVRDRVVYSDATVGPRVDLQIAANNTGIALGDTFVGIEDLYGSNLNDSLLGDAVANILWGANGNDIIYGRDGADTMYGGNGNDILYGGVGADLIDGGAGTRDRVMYSDATVGLRADLQVASTNTGIAAGDIYVGVEDLYGSNLGDSLLGNAGANIIWGANGNDIIYGRDGADTLYGGDGNDFLYGGNQNDVMSGGAGSDSFVFNTALGASNVDAITDYNSAADTMRLDDAVFTGLALGTLSAAAFTLGAAATTAAHRIIYNQTTGQLYFDANGSAAGGQILFATLTANTVINASDFVVF